MRAYRALVSAGVTALLCVSLARCGGDSGTNNGSTATVLDVSVTLTLGEGCDNGGKSAEFLGQANTTVTITATTSVSALTPIFVLYAPDYSTQLGTSHNAGVNKSTLSFKLQETGTHHLTICDAAGVAGAVRIVVTRPLAG